MGDTRGKGRIPSADERFERTDARFSAILFWVIIIAASAACFGWGLTYYYKFLQAGVERELNPKAAIANQLPTTTTNFPKLQLSPAADMDAYRKLMDHATTTYGWVSKEVGVVRIPVERAMELTLARGLPSEQDWPSTGTARDDGGSLPQDSSSGRTSWNIIR